MSIGRNDVERDLGTPLGKIREDGPQRREVEGKSPLRAMNLNVGRSMRLVTRSNVPLSVQIENAKSSPVFHSVGAQADKPTPRVATEKSKLSRRMRDQVTSHLDLPCC